MDNSFRKFENMKPFKSKQDEVKQGTLDRENTVQCRNKTITTVLYAFLMSHECTVEIST